MDVWTSPQKSSVTVCTRTCSRMSPDFGSWIWAHEAPLNREAVPWQAQGEAPRPEPWVCGRLAPSPARGVLGFRLRARPDAKTPRWGSAGLGWPGPGARPEGLTLGYPPASLRDFPGWLRTGRFLRCPYGLPVPPSGPCGAFRFGTAPQVSPTWQDHPPAHLLPREIVISDQSACRGSRALQCPVRSSLVRR